MLSNYISDCEKTKYNFEEILQSVVGYRNKLDLPLDPKEELSYIYQLLQYLRTKERLLVNIAFAYSSSKKYQDHIDAFNDQVTRHLVNHLREYMEDIINGYNPTIQIIEPVITPQIFISYCWDDIAFADLIDNDLQALGYTLTRDQRDLKFKDSIKRFMESIGEHDFVISIISDNYLKSTNCMYEISEVMRNRKYKDKMLLVILNESDKQFITVPVMNNFAANIYQIHHRISYTTYWEQQKDEIKQAIATIQDEANKLPHLPELKRVTNIASNIGEFLQEIQDWNNTSLSELKSTNYAKFVEVIQYQLSK